MAERNIVNAQEMPFVQPPVEARVVTVGVAVRIQRVSLDVAGSVDPRRGPQVHRPG